MLKVGCVGKDGCVRDAKVRTGKSIIKRAVQFPYPMELSCDRTPPNPGILVITRVAAVMAVERIRNIAPETENEH